MTTSTYRAALYGEIRLTGPEHAHLSDDDLIAEAMAEVNRAKLEVTYGGERVRDIEEEDLSIEDWTE